MSKVTKQVDFSGEKIFIEIDVHLKSWQLSNFAEERLLKNFTQPSNKEVLDVYMRTNYPNAQYVCEYESEFSGFWIQPALMKLKYECIVVNTADVPQTDKREKNKTNKIDIRIVAKAARFFPN